MSEEPIKAVENRRPDGTFGPGNNANPDGRPKGKTIKEMVREWLEEHPDDMKSFIEHFIKKDRQLAWRMLEGNPQQDVTSGGEKLPTPLLTHLNVPNNDSNSEDSGPQETN